MAVHIDSSDRLVHDQEQNFVVTCPHCQVTSHITPSAVPRFSELQAHKPPVVGIVCSCDACHAPIFLRYTVRMYGPARIELAPQFVQVERPRETFPSMYLPESVEVLFREALLCFSFGTFNAFASMCRRTAQAVFADLGEAGKLKLFDELNEVRDMAGLDTPTYNKVRSVIFGGEADAHPNPPLLDAYEAGVVLEVMKDLLYEAYVRKGKLQQAMTVRRFFVDEKAGDLASIAKATS